MKLPRREEGRRPAVTSYKREETNLGIEKEQSILKKDRKSKLERPGSHELCGTTLVPVTLYHLCFPGIGLFKTFLFT